MGDARHGGPNPASPIVGDVSLQVHPEVQVRMAALKAAASLGCHTGSRLLSEAADFERWLLEGGRPRP